MVLAEFVMLFKVYRLYRQINRRYNINIEVYYVCVINIFNSLNAQICHNWYGAIGTKVLIKFGQTLNSRAYICHNFRPPIPESLFLTLSMNSTAKASWPNFCILAPSTFLKNASLEKPTMGIGYNLLSRAGWLFTVCHQLFSGKDTISLCIQHITSISSTFFPRDKKISSDE